MKHLSVLLVCALLAGFVAAGVSTLNPPAAKASGGGYVKRCGGGKILLNANEKRVYSLHNRARRNHNLKPFCVDPALQRAASAHSKDMIERDYFSHNTKGRNEDACERIDRYGYRWRYCGENIGYNSTPDDMFRAWMKSPDHRHNILYAKFRQVGIGAYTGDYKGFRTTMYTVDFGTPL